MTPKTNSVRIRTGGVHYSGARIISFLTTDPSTPAIAGSNVITCQDISLSPHGILFTASPHDGSKTHLIPFSNVEIVTFE